LSGATSAHSASRSVHLRGGIASKITSQTLVALLCCAIVLSAVGLFAVHRSEQGRIQSTHPLALQWSQERLGALIDGAPLELTAVARSADLSELISHSVLRFRRKSTARAEVDAALANVLNENSTFESLIVLDPDRDVVSTAGSGLALAELNTRLLGAMEDGGGSKSATESHAFAVEISSLGMPETRVIEFGSMLPQLLASVVLTDKRGREVGSLHGVIRREAMARSLEPALLGRGGNVLIVDVHGRTLASTRDHSPAALPVIPRQLFHGAETVPPELHVRPGNRWVVLSALDSGKYGWTLLAEQPFSEAYFQSLWVALALLVLSAVMIAAWTARIARTAERWVTPLWDLLDAMRMLTRGDSQTEISTQGAVGESEALIRAYNAMVGRLGARQREIETSHKALQGQHEAFQNQYEQVSRLSLTDPLTGVPNRRHFDNQLQREVKRTERDGTGSLVLVILDIDDFKLFNDRYGHAAGDECLKQVATMLREIVRDTDLLARFGGEEFVVVATGTTLEGAVTLAEKIRMEIAEASFIIDDTMRPRKVTVSLGVAEYRGSQADLFKEADAALYRAKASGKNSVVLAPEFEGAGDPPSALAEESNLDLGGDTGSDSSDNNNDNSNDNISTNTSDNTRSNTSDNTDRDPDTGSVPGRVPRIESETNENE